MFQNPEQRPGRRGTFAPYFTLEFRQHYPANDALYLSGEAGETEFKKDGMQCGWINWPRSSRDRELSVAQGGVVARLPLQLQLLWTGRTPRDSKLSTVMNPAAFRSRKLSEVGEQGFTSHCRFSW
jgi:hypothetical protein